MSLTPIPPSGDPLQPSDGLVVARVDSNDTPTGKSFPGIPAGGFLIAFFDGFAVYLDKLRKRADVGDEGVVEGGAGGPHGAEFRKCVHKAMEAVEVTRFNILSLTAPDAPREMSMLDLPEQLFAEASCAHVVLLNGRVIKSRTAPIPGNREL